VADRACAAHGNTVGTRAMIEVKYTLAAVDDGCADVLGEDLEEEC
jgi:hypothetical protein